MGPIWLGLPAVVMIARGVAEVTMFVIEGLFRSSRTDHELPDVDSISSISV